MKKVAGLVLVATALLSACGGGSDSAASQPNLNASALTLTDAEAIAIAPTQIIVANAQLSGTVQVPTNTVSTATHPVPYDQQGSFIELRADSAIDWSQVQVSGLAKATTGHADIGSLTTTTVRPSPLNEQAAYVFIPNQTGYEYLALKITVPNQAAQWLRLQDSACHCTHWILNATALSAGVTSAHVQPVFMPHNEVTGLAAILQTMLYQDDGVTTEAKVLTGIDQVRAAANMPARTGSPSMLDAKLYLSAHGYGTTIDTLKSPADYADSLAQADMGLLSLVTLQGRVYAFWITAVDDTYVYVASPQFGNLVVSWDDMPASMIAVAVKRPVH